MTLDAEKLMQAFDETDARRALVQGFRYGNRHVIRDVARDNDDQVIWSDTFDDDTEGMSHDAMMRRIRLEKLRIVAAKYDEL